MDAGKPRRPWSWERRLGTRSWRAWTEALTSLRGGGSEGLGPAPRQDTRPHPHHTAPVGWNGKAPSAHIRAGGGDRVKIWSMVFVGWL